MKIICDHNFVILAGSGSAKIIPDPIGSVILLVSVLKYTEHHHFRVVAFKL